MGVCGVLDEDDAALVAESAKSSTFGWDEPADVDEDDRRGVRGQGRFDGGGAERERGAVDVGEDEVGAGPQNRDPVA